MTDPALGTLTEVEYLESEELSPVRREYVDGFVYAQAGASLAHSRIASNIGRVFLTTTRRPCWSYTADMKVQIRGTDRLRYYYPDLVVVCGEHESLAQTESNPCLVVEILSASTRKVDMTYKVKDYLSLPSLHGYLLVDSEARAAELYRRLPQGWTQEIVQDEVELPCLNAKLRMDEVYAGVNL